jgi:hypothetical protein
MAKRTGESWPPSKVTRIERNDWVRPSPRDVEDLLNEYGVTDREQRELLIRLAREGRERGWWDSRGLWSSPYSTLIGLETETAEQRTFRSLSIHGLLQTRAYAQALIRQGPAELDAAEVERRVGIRMERQTILTREEDPLRLWCVMDEAVLRRQVGGDEVMAEQMRHLLQIADFARVTLQVIPFDRGAHAGAGAESFDILTFSDPEDLGAVYLELLAGELFVEEPEEVQAYEIAFQHLTALALSPGDTIEVIAAVD